MDERLMTPGPHAPIGGAARQSSPGGPGETAVLLGVIGFLIGTAIFAVVGMRSSLGQQARAASLFPTPDHGLARP